MGQPELPDTSYDVGLNFSGKWNRNRPFLEHNQQRKRNEKEGTDSVPGSMNAESDEREHDLLSF